MDKVLEILALTVEFVFWFIGGFLKGYTIVFLVLCGPVGWIMLYLWKKEVNGTRTLSKP